MSAWRSCSRVLGVLLLSLSARRLVAIEGLAAAMLALAAVSLFVAGAEVAVTGLVLLALVTVAYDAVLRVADERFPFVRTVGLALWVVLLAARARAPLRQPRRRRRHARRLARRSALRDRAGAGRDQGVLDRTRAAAAALDRLRAVRAAAAATSARASVATGRLGIGVSLCAFVVMTMALWALLSNLLDLSLKGVGYLPEIFSPPTPMPGQSTRAGLPASSATSAAPRPSRRWRSCCSPCSASRSSPCSRACSPSSR